MADKFDVAVVGAGVAGCATALYVARTGADVVLLEKARIPGERNVTGGVLFGSYFPGYGLIDLVPSFEQEAPVERQINRHSVCALSKVSPTNDGGSYRYCELSRDSVVSKLGLLPLDWSTGHDYSVLRGRFDKWFARKVVEAGGMLAMESTVESLIWENDEIIGLRTTDEEVYADLIIDASGVTSNLIEKAALRQQPDTGSFYHGIKHVYKLEPGTIEERLSVKEGVGKAIVFLGDFMEGLSGGGFLYTNKDTISLGIVINLRNWVSNSMGLLDKIGKPLDLLAAFERHPFISRIIEGATLLEYSAHNIPIGSKCMIAKPYRDRFLAIGDALGSFIKIGSLIDGMRPAIATGIMAGETYLHSKKRNDFSEKSLSYFDQAFQPIRRKIKRSKLDSYLLESRLAYHVIPRMLFSLGPFSQKIEVSTEVPGFEKSDAIDRIQQRTGLLDYDEDREYSHIRIDNSLCQSSETKPWVSACPYNCYTLVLKKGVFASFKDLYDHNVSVQIKKNADDAENVVKNALEETRSDIKLGEVRFDHVACVGCGTCGIIGPKETVIFGPERRGHGVRFKYG
ncbi:MAG: hypothetical protein CMO12_02510 [Thaumarchaeota archaeon]|nr:hypothetical protein [Nitrososphaerota archaeon]